MDDLITLHDQSPGRKIIDQITCHQKQNGRRFHPLAPTGKNRELLKPLFDSKLSISGSKSTTCCPKVYLLPVLEVTSHKSNCLRKSVGISGCFGSMVSSTNLQNKYQLTLKGIKLTNGPHTRRSSASQLAFKTDESLEPAQSGQIRQRAGDLYGVLAIYVTPDAAV